MNSNEFKCNASMSYFQTCFLRYEGSVAEAVVECKDEVLAFFSPFLPLTIHLACLIY